MAQFGQLREKGILFGDDYFGVVADEKVPIKNADGIWIKEYLIVPLGPLVNAYPELKKPGALPVSTPWGNAIWRQYPMKWVSDMNPSRSHAVARIDCTFNGEETTHTRRYQEYTKYIDTLEMENEQANSENQLLKDIMKEKLGYLADFASLQQEIVETIGGGKIDGRREEKLGDQEA